MTKSTPIQLSRHEEATIRLYETISDITKRFDAGKLNQDDINSIKRGALQDLKSEYEYLKSYKDYRDICLASTNSVDEEFAGHFGIPEGYDIEEDVDD